MPKVYAGYHSGLNYGVCCVSGTGSFIFMASRGFARKLARFSWQKDRPEL